jgi:hypothetical protein
MRRFFIDDSVKPASLYVVDGDAIVAEAHELERASNLEETLPPKGTGHPPVLEEEEEKKEEDQDAGYANLSRVERRTKAFVMIRKGATNREITVATGYGSVSISSFRRKIRAEDGEEVGTKAKEESSSASTVISPEDEQMVWDIRSKFVVQKLSPPEVCAQLGISLPQFIAYCRRYDIKG